jgi:ribosomal protein L7Ae-like RNA K-turn-binding protein
MFVYMKVTKDKYELPVAIADSAKELAEICGTKRTNILSAIIHAEQRGQNSVYKKVEVDDE